MNTCRLVQWKVSFTQKCESPYLSTHQRASWSQELSSNSLKCGSLLWSVCSSMENGFIMNLLHGSIDGQQYLRQCLSQDGEGALISRGTNEGAPLVCIPA